MNTLRQIRQIVYRLNRDFGTPAVLTKAGSSTLDIETGSVVRVSTDYPIRRVIILPRTLVRQFLPKGHMVDVTKRTCLISRKDLSVDISPADHISIGGERYSIAPIESDLNDANYLLELKRVE